MVEEMALLLSPLFWKLCPLSRGTLVLRQLSIKCQRIQRRSLQVQYPLLILLKSRKQVSVNNFSGIHGYSVKNGICWCRCSTVKLSRRVTMPKDFI
ncbi:hypothetical protein E1A91_A01G177800v1 [Gossypium mustelinum]|uniref:Uncharacterized protein n=3 Tax=Gossypium TaxID=3633 RepID=A0A5J5WZP2_GOSBA|nr:hypothetical protein ES319_A01G173400v1 [Gossypium barbadense]TYH31646.1 hypothetical protein ES288_A01G188600v1 [Gossypium darwinii]TYJ50033.1 hypothetical protein E1A91_A01G177800v1 [Gossypium mustelinum]